MRNLNDLISLAEMYESKNDCSLDLVYIDILLNQISCKIHDGRLSDKTRFILTKHYMALYELWRKYHDW